MNILIVGQDLVRPDIESQSIELLVKIYWSTKL